MKAVAWSGADVFTRQGVQFFVSIMLARLLAPEHFGIVAVLSVFISLSAIFIDGGFSYALIQHQDITTVDECSVFCFNVGLAIVAATLLCAAAPWIASYFKQPVLRPLAYLMSVDLLLKASSGVQKAMLTKRLNIRSVFIVGLAASLISGVLAVVLALAGFGVWSLAGQTIVSSGITTVLLWWLYPLRPLSGFRVASLAKLFGFGKYMMVSSLLNAAYSSLLTVLVAKLFSARNLGFYLRAQGTQTIPVNLLSNTIERVALPVLSTTATDHDQLVRGIRRLLTGMMLINVPTMLGLAALSEQVIATLFGAKWLPAVPYLQVLCLAGVFWPMHVVNLTALLAQGRSDLFFRLEVAKTILGVSTILFASFHGMMAIVWSQVAVGLICFFINAHYTDRLLGYGALRQLRDVFPLEAVATMMAIVIWALGRAIHFPAAFELLILVPLGAVIFFMICHWFDIGRFSEALLLLRQSGGSALNTKYARS